MLRSTHDETLAKNDKQSTRPSGKKEGTKRENPSPSPKNKTQQSG